MEGIATFTREIVGSLYDPQGGGGGEQTDLSVPCPSCGGALVLNERFCACKACPLKLWRTIAGRVMSQEEMESLLRDKSLPTMTGFVSSAKKPFSAGLAFNLEEAKIEFVFEKREVQRTAFDARCPCCGKPVEVDDRSCACTNCKFKLWLEIASRKLTPAELKILLTEKQTASIDGFKSKAGKKFAARLKLKEPFDGKVDFVFD